jgi:hypothetical protein
MRVVVQVQRLRFSHEAMKRALKTWRPLDIGNSRGLCRLLLVQFRAFPNGQLLIRLSAE